MGGAIPGGIEGMAGAAGFAVELRADLLVEVIGIAG